MDVPQLYFCNFANVTIQQKDKYLVKILTVSHKKAITWKLGQSEPPTLDKWTEIVEEIYSMAKLKHTVTLQEAEME